MVISKQSIIKIDVKKSELKGFEVLKNKFEKDILELKSTKNNLLLDISLASTKINSLLEDKKSLAEDISSKQTKINALIIKYDNLKNAIEEFGNVTPKIIEDNFNKNKSLIEQIKNNETESVNSIKDLESLKKETGINTFKLNKLKEDYSKVNLIVNELTNKENSLKDNIKLLEKELEDIEQIKQELNNLKTEISKSKETLKINNDKILKSEDSIKDLDNKQKLFLKLCNDIFEKENKLKILISGINTVKQDLEYNNKLKTDKDNLEKSIVDNEKRLSLINSSLSNKTIELQNIENNIKTILDNVEKENNNILIKKSELEKLNLEIEQKQKESEIISRKNNNEMNLLKAKREEISHMILVNKQHLKGERVANILRELNE